MSESECEPKWNQKECIDRLEKILQVMPGWSHGNMHIYPTQQLCSIVQDAMLFQAVSKAVYKAINAPKPHPVFGDDGHRDRLREKGMSALAWGEEWSRYRSSQNWNPTTRYQEFMGYIPKSG